MMMPMTTQMPMPPVPRHHQAMMRISQSGVSGAVVAVADGGGGTAIMPRAKMKAKMKPRMKPRMKARTKRPMTAATLP